MIVPYLLIAATWYGIKYLLIQQNPTGFFYELSTLLFWIDHQGSWYVAMLVPVYLIFPWYYDLVENGNRQNKLTRNFKIVAVGVVASIATFILSIINPLVYSHLSQVFSSVIVYIIGYYCAVKIMACKYNGYLISIICVIFYSKS